MVPKMPVINPEKLIALQRNADEVRNVRHKNSVDYPVTDTVCLYRSVYLLMS
jgi:hypothetical protein